MQSPIRIVLLQLLHCGNTLLTTLYLRGWPEGHLRRAPISLPPTQPIIQLMTTNNGQGNSVLTAVTSNIFLKRGLGNKVTQGQRKFDQSLLLINRQMPGRTRSPSPIDLTFQPISTPLCPSPLTKSEEQSVAMWLHTIIEPHSLAFFRALEAVSPIGAMELHNYFQDQYGHHQEVVELFVLAALQDYNLLRWDPNSRNAQPAHGRQLEVIVEELVGRYFRESEWMHKIRHVPVYDLFGLLDPTLKGYLTLQEIRKFISCRLPHTRPQHPHCHPLASLLLEYKLKHNLGSLQAKMTQENIDELQLRAAPNHTLLPNQTTPTYTALAHKIAHHSQAQIHKAQIECEEALSTNRQNLSQLDLVEEDTAIKRRAREYSQPHSAVIPPVLEPNLIIPDIPLIEAPFKDNHSFKDVSKQPVSSIQDKQVPLSRHSVEKGPWQDASGSRKSSQGRVEQNNDFQEPPAARIELMIERRSTAKKQRTLLHFGQQNNQANTNRGQRSSTPVKPTNLLESKLSPESSYGRVEQTKSKMDYIKQVDIYNSQTETISRAFSASKKSSSEHHEGGQSLGQDKRKAQINRLLITNQILKQLDEIRAQKRKTHCMFLQYV